MEVLLRLIEKHKAFALWMLKKYYEPILLCYLIQTNEKVREFYNPKDPALFRPALRFGWEERALHVFSVVDDSAIDEKCLKYIVKHNMKEMAKRCRADLLLPVAIEENNFEIFQRIVDVWEIDCFITACTFGRLEMVQYLAENCYVPFMAYCYGFVDATAKDHVEIVKFICEHINIVGMVEHHDIHFAAHNRAFKCVDYLLRDKRVNPYGLEKDYYDIELGNRIGHRQYIDQILSGQRELPQSYQPPRLVPRKRAQKRKRKVQTEIDKYFQKK